VVSQPLWDHSSLCVAVTDAVQDVAVKPVSEICASDQSEAGREG